METKFYKLAGYCLISGCLLMVLTMVLHPTGGDIGHIIKISRMAIIAHSIGVLSVPFTTFGFYGLSKSLQTDSKVSFLGFVFMGFALAAVLLAAALNGLVLPMYVLQHPGETGHNLESLQLIVAYNTTFNAALDFIFISGYTIAMLIFSVLMTKHIVFPRWLGIWGMLLTVGIIFSAGLQLNFISVRGFTVYVLFIVSWISTAGYYLIHYKPAGK